MSDTPYNEYAFPQKEPLTSDHPGMSLRDYFAAEAMCGIEASQGNGGHFVSAVEKVAERAYQLADAMLKARQS